MIHLSSTGAKISGAPFTRYYSFTDDEIDFEAGIPVIEPIEASGRIAPLTMPAGPCASAWHVGPYDQLDRTYGQVDTWIEEKGITVTGLRPEIYWTDPGMEPDPKKWRTQVIVPCEPQEKQGK